MMTNILLIILNVNVFLIMLIVLAIYSKCEDIIDYKERQSQAIIDLVTGFLEGFKGFGADKSK